MGTIGLIANPASGKDIRRLVAAASVFDNQEKRNIVRRAVLGAIAAGVRRVLYLPDTHRLVESAIEGLASDCEFVPVESPQTGTAIDTTRAVSRMREEGCNVVITLGGDGTNRAAAKGWRTVPLVAISTGTNNVFPRMVEGTLAGAAAAAVASGRFPLQSVARQAKTLSVKIDGESDDLALIDVVLLDPGFNGARAIWDPGVLRRIVLARADPAAVGVSAIGGLLRPLGDTAGGGLRIDIGEGGPAVLRTPIAPGLYVPVPIRDFVRVRKGEAVRLHGPGLIALDGERERRLQPGQCASVSIGRDGPWVIDIATAMDAARRAGIFLIPPGGKNRGH